MMSHYEIANNTFGDHTRIHQGNVYNNYPADRISFCLADLRITDPQDDKTRIEEVKGGLLRGSYRWILDHADFQTWKDDPHCRLLWIKGDPGKGKTMLLCGIIDEMEKLNSYQLSYFFCQATEARLKSATSVLRGLIYGIIVQQPLLISHVQEKYDHAGKQLFEDGNAWTTLSKILKAILGDPRLEDVVLIIDALDECVEGLPHLLNLIASASSSVRTKWIVSSRNWPSIEEALDNTGRKIRLCLELNQDSISAAVLAYIQHKVQSLEKQKKYNSATRDAIEKHLISNANDTFLWVALVCESLKEVTRWQAVARVRAFPPGLNSLYKRMLDRVLEMNNGEDSALYKQILAVVTTVYRPVTLHELCYLIGNPEYLSDDIESFEQILQLCGSFLTVRDSTIYFVHQSAKDHLLEDVSARNSIFPFGREAIHHSIFYNSIQVMSEKLTRDMYKLRNPGPVVDEMKTPDPDPLVAIRYSCVYWPNHLCEESSDEIWAVHQAYIQDDGIIFKFLHDHFLHWLEALGLLRSTSDGIRSIIKLETLLNNKLPKGKLRSLLQDVRRFILYNKQVVENAPLQTYISALIFSPLQSLVREIFYPKALLLGMKNKPMIDNTWSPCLQTLEEHDDIVICVTFSRDCRRIASGSYDKTVKVWDTATGACIQTFEGHTDGVAAVAFSADGQYIASGSQDETVKVWDTATGFVNTLWGHNNRLISVKFSEDGKQLVSKSHNEVVRIWDVATCKCVRTYKDESRFVESAVPSEDGQYIASGSSNHSVRVRNIQTGDTIKTLYGHTASIEALAFSTNSQLLASGSYDRSVKLWDMSTGYCLQTLKGHSKEITSVAFSADGQYVASGAADNAVKIWDIVTETGMNRPQEQAKEMVSVAFSKDRQQMALGSLKRIEVFDVATGSCVKTLQGHNEEVSPVAFSMDGRYIASGATDTTVKVWNADSGTCKRTYHGHTSAVRSIAFSADSRYLVSGSYDKMVIVWDIVKGVLVRRLKGHSGYISSLAFSANGLYIASGSDDKTVKIWEATTGTCTQTLRGYCSGMVMVVPVALSADSRRIALASHPETVRIWEIALGTCIQTYYVGMTVSHLAFDLTNSHRLFWNGGYLDVGKEPHVSYPMRITGSSGFGVDKDGKWVTKDGKPVLWVPPDYRGENTVVTEEMLAIRRRSIFRLLVLQFSGTTHW